MHDPSFFPSSNGGEVEHEDGVHNPSAMLDHIETVLKGLHPVELRQLVRFMETLEESP